MLGIPILVVRLVFICRDKVVLSLMLGLSFFDPAERCRLIWFLKGATASAVLSFDLWDGIGDLGAIKCVGTQNYHNALDQRRPASSGRPSGTT